MFKQSNPFKNVKLSIFINNKKDQYSEENIIYSNRLHNANKKRRSSAEVNKILNDWQEKLRNKPIDVEQKYYYSDKQLDLEGINIIVKKQEKIEL